VTKTEEVLAMAARTNAPGVAIVGGGLAGLAAAIHAARETGAPVTLFERGSGLGGRARTTVKNGYRLNLGPHALYPASRQMLAELGVTPSAAPPRLIGAVLLGGRLVPMTAGVTSILVDPAFDGGPRDEVLSLLRALGAQDFAAVDRVAVDAWLGEALNHTNARQLVEGFIRVASYTNAPDIMSAGAAARQLRAGAAGVLYVDGGWATLVEGLCERAAAAGVTIRTGARVEHVVVEAGRVVGLALAGGGFHAASGAILTGEPGNVAAMVSGPPGAALREQVRGLHPVRAAVLDLGLRRLPRPEFTYGVGLDRPLYFSVHSAVARLAPEGGALVSLARYLHPGEAQSADHEREMEAFADLLQPGWRDEVVLRRCLPNILVSGAVAEAAKAGEPGRPTVAVPGVRGLAIAGDWVGPQGMLTDAALASAKAAAAHVGRDILAREPSPVG
jgi:phytoene dehydrogenase-like protein